MKRLGILMLLVGLAVTGCKSGGDSQGLALVKDNSPDSAEKFLKWSMDQHKALKTYHAQFAMKYDAGPTGGGGMGSYSPTMTVDYEAPNKFRIETNTMGMVSAVISDGKKQVSSSGLAGFPSQTAVAPSSLAVAAGGSLGAAFGNASPMLTMFAGSSGYEVLVDKSKGKPTFGETKDFNGEKSREVKFAANGVLGNCTVLIGETTGMAYHWDCDMTALLSMYQGMGKAATTSSTGSTGGSKTSNATTDVPSKLLLTFNAGGLKANGAIDAMKFDTTKLPDSKMPDMASLTKSSGSPDTAMPDEEGLKEGQPAPAFTVTGLDGKTVSLASLKGKPVMLDFWATWCGPCKQTLPETDEISRTYKNLTVLAISDEEKPVVEKFVTENHYKFHTCLDTTHATNPAYKITGIPCFVFIDAQGKVAKYIIGSGQSGAVKAALKQIGAVKG